MASRVNTKFVLVMSIMIIGVVALIAGLWLWRLKADASRNIRKGDEFMAVGDLDKAYKYYGRAVHKEPGRLDYLGKLEDALLEMHPETSDVATERYYDWLAVLRHEVQHYPTDPQSHLNLVEELHSFARMVNSIEQWEMLEVAANEMWERVPPQEELRDQARVYRGLARMRQGAVLTREELDEAEQDLLVAVDVLPDSDIAWAALVRGQLGISERMRAEGQTQRADEKWQQTLASLRQALVSVPEGTEVAKVNLLCKLQGRRNDEESVTDEELIAAADHIDAVFTPEVPSWSLVEAANLLNVMYRLDGTERAMSLLKDNLDDDSDSSQTRFVLARMQYRQGELDEAYERATEVIDSEPLPVSLASRMQFQLRKQAAGLLVDIEQLRWERGDTAEHDELVANIEAARDRLAMMVADPATDPILLGADGKLAYAKREYRRAASKLEDVVRMQEGVDAQIRMYLATSLQRIGDVGRALEQMRLASAELRSPLILFPKARLEFDLGRLDDAARTVDQLLRLDPDHPAGKRLASLIQMQLRGGEIDDPVVAAVQRAHAASVEGDQETARATLLLVLKDYPDNVPLLLATALADLEIGDRDAARQHLEHALEVQPGHPRTRGLLSSMDVDDPIESLIAYYRAFYDSEVEFDVAVAVNLPATAATAARRAQLFESQGKAEAAAEQQEIADRATQLAAEALVRAIESDPDNPQLIEFRFLTALRDEDWDTATRMIAKASELNVDQADGLLYRGRYELIRGQHQDAIRTLEEATEEIPYSAVAWRSLGTTYQEVGNFTQAVLAFEEAFLSDPAHLQTVRQYVGLLDRVGRQEEALSILRTVKDGLVDGSPLMEIWLGHEAEVGDRAVALRERMRRFEEVPEDKRNAARLASLLGRTEPAYELLVDDQGRRRLSPQAWSRLPRQVQQRELDEARAQWRQQSDEIIASLIADAPDDLELRRLKASVVQAQGDLLAAERVLVDFIESFDEADRTARMFLALGEFQAENNLYSEAIQSFLKARELQDDATRPADVALGRMYFLGGDYARAAESFRRVLEVNPNRQVRMQLVETLTQLGSLDEAQQELESLVAVVGPTSLTKLHGAAIAKARADQLYADGKIEEANRYYDEQRMILAEAQELDPGNPLPQIALAQSLMQEHARTSAPGLLEDALHALERAESIRAGTEEARMIRAEINRMMGRESSAIAELIRLIQDDPANDNARLMVLRYYDKQRNVDAAIELAREGAEKSRSIAYWNDILGDRLASGKQDYEAAAAAYGAAYRLDDSVKLLSKLADVMLAVDQPDYQAVLDMIDASPEERRDDPIISYLQTKAYVGLNRRRDAEAMARKTYAQLQEQIAEGFDPRRASALWFRAVGVLYPSLDAKEAERFVLDVCGDDPGVYVLNDLAAHWAKAGSSGMSRAIELQRRAIDAASEEEPTLQGSLYGILAQYHIASGDLDAADAAFGKAVELSPDNPDTLNNYAYLLAEHLDRAGEALQHAQRAVELVPENNPSLLDTLGWVEFKQGDYEAAEEHLLESARLDENPGTLLHLAHVQMKRNDPMRAQRSLIRASELRPDPETKAEIDRLADDIRTMGNQDR